MTVSIPAQQRWLNQPSQYQLDDNELSLTTRPHTDLWQRTYYGFRVNNAPALLFSRADNFTLTVAVDFDYQAQYDQCGVLIYLDEACWFKASIEFETAEMSRLGSVVTQHGYSDWATQEIKTTQQIWYRLHRRGADFMLQASADGQQWQQLRIFHLSPLEPTTQQMACAMPPLPARDCIEVGFYACSPTESSFTAHFSNWHFGPCEWAPHSPAL